MWISLAISSVRLLFKYWSRAAWKVSALPDQKLKKLDIDRSYPETRNDYLVVLYVIYVYGIPKFEHSSLRLTPGSGTDYIQNMADWVLGLRVRVTTILDNTITGTVYSFCTVTNTVTIAEDPAVPTPAKKEEKQTETGPLNYRIIKVPFIKDAVAIEKPSKKGNQKELVAEIFSKATPSIGYVSIRNIDKKGSASIKAAREAKETKGINVTPEAQELFDKLYKMLPTRWHDKSIIVVDEVRIDPPYQESNCLADNPNSQALDLVKRVVKANTGKIVKGG